MRKRAKRNEADEEGRRPDSLGETIRFARVAMQDVVKAGTIFPVGKGATRRMVRWSGAKAGETVLDAGAGHGNVSDALLALPSAPAKIIAVERSEAMHALFEDRFRGRPDGRLSLVRGDILELPSLLAGTYGAVDRVVSTLPVSRLYHSLRIFRTFFDALRPGGVLVQVSSDPFHCLKNLARAGFRVTGFRAEIHGFYPLFIFRAVRA